MFQTASSTVASPWEESIANAGHSDNTMLGSEKPMSW